MSITLRALEYSLPAPIVIELDPEAGHIAFNAAKRDLVSPEQVAAADDVLEWAVAHAEATR